jgi:hypothetical protein
VAPAESRFAGGSGAGTPKSLTGSRQQTPPTPGGGCLWHSPPVLFSREFIPKPTSRICSSPFAGLDRINRLSFILNNLETIPRCWRPGLRPESSYWTAGRPGDQLRIVSVKLAGLAAAAKERSGSAVAKNPRSDTVASHRENGGDCGTEQPRTPVRKFAQRRSDRYGGLPSRSGSKFARAGVRNFS